MRAAIARIAEFYGYIYGATVSPVREYSVPSISNRFPWQMVFHDINPRCTLTIGNGVFRDAGSLETLLPEHEG